MGGLNETVNIVRVQRMVLKFKMSEIFNHFDLRTSKGTNVSQLNAGLNDPTCRTF